MEVGPGRRELPRPERSRRSNSSDALGSDVGASLRCEDGRCQRLWVVRGALASSRKRPPAAEPLAAAPLDESPRLPPCSPWVSPLLWGSLGRRTPRSRPFRYSRLLDDLASLQERPGQVHSRSSRGRWRLFAVHARWSFRTGA